MGNAGGGPVKPSTKSWGEGGTKEKFSSKHPGKNAEGKKRGISTYLQKTKRTHRVGKMGSSKRLNQKRRNGEKFGGGESSYNRHNPVGGWSKTGRGGKPIPREEVRKRRRCPCTRSEQYLGERVDRCARVVWVRWGGGEGKKNLLSSPKLVPRERVESTLLDRGGESAS